MIKASNVVVGGGIVGLLAAWYLAKRGVATEIFDRQELGRESSWAGGGILSPLYPAHSPSLQPLVGGSAQIYPALAEELREISGIDPELVDSGLLVLDGLPNPNEKDAPQGTAIPGPNLPAYEPQLAAFPGGALRYPAAQIRNTRLLKALGRSLNTFGVRISEHRPVVDFFYPAGRLEGVRMEDGTVIATETCVLSAGAWTGALLERTGLKLPIKPVKGQMLVIKATPGFLRHILVYHYYYLIPRRDGRILVGSTLENTGFDKSTTRTAYEELREVAIKLVPLIATYPIEHHWAGLRPGTPDGIPYIGEHPTIRGLYVCAGHHRNGFATGPASSQLVVDLLLGRKPAIDPTPYRLDRPIVPWSD